MIIFKTNQSMNKSIINSNMKKIETKENKSNSII